MSRDGSRVWQLYVARVFLFVFFIAYIARTAEHYDNPMLAHEFNIFNFLRHPDVMLLQGLMLKFKPVDLDVLPLYIVLLLASPFILWVMTRRLGLTLLAAAALYLVARALDWNLPSFPAGTWYFNPITWQLLFVFGMWCALGGAKTLAPLIHSRAMLVLAVGYLVFAFLIVMTWHVPSWARLVPSWLAHAMYPIDKTNLDPLRLIHFLAMAVLAVRYIPRTWPALTARWSRPLILCGQHSLPIFVLGTFLSFAAHIILVEISNTVAVQILVSVVGIALLVVAAWIMTWYKKNVDLQSGEPQLKNIATRVRVYRVRLNGFVPREAPPLVAADKPSIAVLPFENLSGIRGRNISPMAWWTTSPPRYRVFAGSWSSPAIPALLTKAKRSMLSSLVASSGPLRA